MHDAINVVVVSREGANIAINNAYRLAKPMDVPKGTVIHCTAHFDNSDKNPNNPDPSKTVRWGDQTWQEMMVGCFSRWPAASELEKRDQKKNATHQIDANS